MRPNPAFVLPCLACLCLQAQAPPIYPGQRFTGQAVSSRSNRTWPTDVLIVTVDRWGAMTGEMAWPNLGSRHRIVGRYQNGLLEFTEVSALQPGGAHLNVHYRVSPRGSGLWGTWTDPMGDEGTLDVQGTQAWAPAPPPPPPPPGGAEAVLFKLESLAGVSNGPYARTVFTLDQPAVITKIWTYHWNGGQGAGPGAIGLRSLASGQLVGRWGAVGTYHGFSNNPGDPWPAQGDGPPFLYWNVQPGVELAPGDYEVTDSSPGTWSTNGQLGGRGVAWVFGQMGGAAPASGGWNDAAAPPPDPGGGAPPPDAPPPDAPAFDVPPETVGVSVASYPELAQVPGYPVYYAPGMNSNYFFYDGMFWLFQNDQWYASSWFNGPWGLIRPEAVPVFVLRVPVSYYRRMPTYFGAWRRDDPPRWGEHWGPAWERRQHGWDQWDRHAVYHPAPLPEYQRSYAGHHYPRAEEQRALHTEHYHYQPTTPVARQHFQQIQHPAPQGRAPQAPVQRPGMAPQQPQPPSVQRPGAAPQLPQQAPGQRPGVAPQLPQTSQQAPAQRPGTMPQQPPTTQQTPAQRPGATPQQPPTTQQAPAQRPGAAPQQPPTTQQAPAQRPGTAPQQPAIQHPAQAPQAPAPQKAPASPPKPAPAPATPDPKKKDTKK